jgi:hypothetical protein
VSHNWITLPSAPAKLIGQRPTGGGDGKKSKANSWVLPLT